ncbi:MAG: ribonuclease R [Gemmataceae bacterium]|nr:ribonuclease R [Gemmataceae bacterium]
MQQRILDHVSKTDYQPVKPKALARKLGVHDDDYPDFRDALKALIRDGKVLFGPGHSVKPVGQRDSIVGTIKFLPSGRAMVRVAAAGGKAPYEIEIPAGYALDAANGDTVLVKLGRKTGRGTKRFGAVSRIVARASRQFVGTYHERDGTGLVRIDGNQFGHSIIVGDPGAKGAKPDDKVVVELIRYPSADERGEGVITEVLGAHGAPGVDTLSVIRAYELPDAFPEEVLEEARATAAAFRPDDLVGREDMTADLIVTIDPADARDHDDAVSLTRDPKTGHWMLGVHIADVSHFAPPGSALDREARKRGTSVYLPQRVLPMFPEILSNGLASLHEGQVRFTKSAIMEFTAAGAPVHARFVNGAINVRKRFTYEQVSAAYAAHDAGKNTKLSEDILELLLRMRELALIFRKRRKKRGALELDMPEPVLEYDDDGKVTGAHFADNDISHQVIEECMLAANVAVANQLHGLRVPFLRRVHPAPDPRKLQGFAAFARILGYKIEREVDRFSLQKVIDQSAGKPEKHALHFAMLRSLKQAVYSPHAEEHFALAYPNYCHFTSPIRRYPDLTVHRLLDRYIRTGSTSADEAETLGLGEHCSRTERRAEAAERELVKLRLMDYLSNHIGAKFPAVITGVADYGFFAQCETFPAEGRVHISTLTDDYYVYDEEAHTLLGKKSKKRFRLGDQITIEVVRVDRTRRQVDMRVADDPKPEKKKKDVKSPRRKRD